jgi:DNA-binding transcriptional LysR family regulator
MDLQLLETFLDLAETKNFTMTAKRLKKSQAAISLQINRLEEMLGKFLFDRDNRNVNLSQDGEILMGYAKQILNMHQELLFRFSSLPIEGSVSFGSPEDIAITYLPEIISLFSKQYPKIHLQVHSDVSSNLLNQFKNGTLDMVLIQQDADRPEADTLLVKEEALVWIKSKDASIDFSKPIPLVVGAPSCYYRQKMIEALERANIAYRIVYASPSLSGRITAVKAGLGISAIPIGHHKKELEQFETAQLPKLPKMQLAILKSKKITLAQEALADHIIMQIQA